MAESLLVPPPQDHFPRLAHRRQNYTFPGRVTSAPKHRGSSVVLSVVLCVVVLSVGHTRSTLSVLSVVVFLSIRSEHAIQEADAALKDRGRPLQVASGARQQNVFSMSVGQLTSVVLILLVFKTNNVATRNQPAIGGGRYHSRRAAER